MKYDRNEEHGIVHYVRHFPGKPDGDNTRDTLPDKGYRVTFEVTYMPTKETHVDYVWVASIENGNKLVSHWNGKSKVCQYKVKVIQRIGEETK